MEKLRGERGVERAIEGMGRRRMGGGEREVERAIEGMGRGRMGGG